jgi:hypothetical protein
MYTGYWRSENSVKMFGEQTITRHCADCPGLELDIRLEKSVIKLPHGKAENIRSSDGVFVSMGHKVCGGF